MQPLPALLAAQVLAQHAVLVAEEKVLVELNTIEPAENPCRLNFSRRVEIELSAGKRRGSVPRDSLPRRIVSPH
jgi:hypothetical protein